MKIIGVIGHAGSGKDTVADLIRDLCRDKHVTVARTSLATPIKDVAWRTFGWDGEKDEKGRQLLIDLGMAGRAYDRDVWLDQGVRNLTWQNAQINLIPDIRFENEADYIFTHGGILIRVIRDSVEPMSHESERQLDDYLTPITLTNNGTIEELKAELYSELERINLI
jgi:ABC-type dipeptide/oligopeptide/nickel transport system ATPase component